MQSTVGGPTLVEESIDPGNVTVKLDYIIGRNTDLDLRMDDQILILLFDQA